ncbi:MAG: SoxR reducing system RseC family protein [Ignavibacteria bacterium]|nr:SoxR reducing system RseC family protein [Ignavibacteria bacterium]
MFNEQLAEKGQVLEKSGEKIRIQINSNVNCEDCSAKIFCNPCEIKKIIEVRSNKNFKKGDEVKISVKGSQIVLFSLLYYGIPLVLLITGIIISDYFIKNSGIKDLISFLSGLLLSILYYITLYFTARKKYLKNCFIEISKTD